MHNKYMTRAKKTSIIIGSSKTHTKILMNWSPHVTVAAIIEDNGKFLMVEEDIRGEIIFNQPAGHLDDAESLIEAVIREAREETAWHIQADYLCNVQLWRNPDNQESFLRFSFICTPLQHFPNEKLDKGILRAVWLSRDEISQRVLRSPLVLDSIDRYLSGERHPLEAVRHILS